MNKIKRGIIAIPPIIEIHLLGLKEIIKQIRKIKIAATKDFVSMINCLELA